MILGKYINMPNINISFRFSSLMEYTDLLAKAKYTVQQTSPTYHWRIQIDWVRKIKVLNLASLLSLELLAVPNLTKSVFFIKTDSTQTQQRKLHVLRYLERDLDFLLNLYTLLIIQYSIGTIGVAYIDLYNIYIYNNNNKQKNINKIRYYKNYILEPRTAIIQGTRQNSQDLEEFAKDDEGSPLGAQAEGSRKAEAEKK
ncbi:hypothetical protein ACJX0J_039320 [Zea mays]